MNSAGNVPGIEAVEPGFEFHQSMESRSLPGLAIEAYLNALAAHATSEAAITHTRNETILDMVVDMPYGKKTQLFVKSDGSIDGLPDPMLATEVTVGTQEQSGVSEITTFRLSKLGKWTATHIIGAPDSPETHVIVTLPAQGSHDSAISVQ